VDAEVDRSTWAPQPVFDLIARTGDVPRAELELTFNLGVGMVAVAPADRAADVLALAAERGLAAWRLGELRPGAGAVRLTGDYAGVAANWR
jgi:phosphoribosylformylglycinamidine cyclo-ligase